MGSKNADLAGSVIKIRSNTGEMLQGPVQLVQIHLLSPGFCLGDMYWFINDISGISNDDDARSYQSGQNTI